MWLNIADASGDPSGRFADVTIRLGSGASGHPDPHADLAGTIIHHIEQQPLMSGEKLFYRSLPEALIPTGHQWIDVSVGDDVYVPGCPAGLFDEVNHTPFLRKGTISNFPRESARQFFYVDMPTFDGASGSPVIVDAHFSFDRKGGGYELRNRYYLVGVITDGLAVDNHDAQSDLHFGKAIKADRLPELYKAMVDDAQTRHREAQSR